MNQEEINREPESPPEEAFPDMRVDELRTEFKRLRKERGQTQGDIAKRLSVSQATISAFEQGKYGAVRKKTLNSIYNLVRFWKKDIPGIVKADFTNRRTAPLFDREAAAPHHPVVCPSCRAELPDMDPPARYCPKCGEEVRSACRCGKVLKDPDANFCSACGRSLLREGQGAQSYPLLDNDRDEALRLLLRRLLENGVEQASVAQVEQFLGNVERGESEQA